MARDGAFERAPGVLVDREAGAIAVADEKGRILRHVRKQPQRLHPRDLYYRVRGRRRVGALRDEMAGVGVAHRDDSVERRRHHLVLLKSEALLESRLRL